MNNQQDFGILNFTYYTDERQSLYRIVINDTRNEINVVVTTTKDSLPITKEWGFHEIKNAGSRESAFNIMKNLF